MRPAKEGAGATPDRRRHYRQGGGTDRCPANHRCRAGVRAHRHSRPHRLPTARTARFAPNGGNRQAWRVIVVKDPEVRRALRDAYLPGWYQYLAQVGAGLTPWAVVTDVELERRAVAGAPDIERLAAEGPGGFAEHFDQVPVMLVVVADLTRLATVDRDNGHYTMVGGASIYPFAWSILLAARSEGLAGVLTTMVVREEATVKQVFGHPRHGVRSRRAGPGPSGAPTHQAAPAAGGEASPPSTGSTVSPWRSGESPHRRREWAQLRPEMPLGFAELIDDIDGLGFDSIWLPEILTAPGPRPPGRPVLRCRSQLPPQAGHHHAGSGPEPGAAGQAAGRSGPAVRRSIAGHPGPWAGPPARVGRRRCRPRQGPHDGCDAPAAPSLVGAGSRSPTGARRFRSRT